MLSLRKNHTKSYNKTMINPLKFSPKETEILRQIQRFARVKKVKLYLVGGALRDLIIKRQKENPDFDFCLKKGAINFGRQLAAKMRAGFVVLDKEHGACRIVKKIKSGLYTLDFTDFRGKTLEEDLAHRDFTINSIVLKLEDAVSRRDLSDLFIDPCYGRQDLARKILRSANKAAFIEDPLRILRAFSFSSMLGFEIDKETLRLTKLEKDKLPQVSGERVREELFKIFDSADAGDCLDELNRLKILEIIFPELKKMRGIGQGPYHHLDVLEHTLETVRQLDILFKAIIDKETNDYLNEYICAQRMRRSLIKFGAILHDVGKPAALRRIEGKLIFHGHERVGLGMARDICERLRLSNDEARSLHKMILCHLRPGYLADNDCLTARAKFRYFRDSGNEAVSILLLSVADQRATKGPLTTKASRMRHEKICFGLIKEYFRKNKEEKPPRLLNGDILMKEFKLKPSPLIGKILSRIEELQAIGKIKNRQEALASAKKIIGVKK